MLARFLDERSISWDTALFLLSVFLFFFLLPLRTDATATILLMTICASLVIYRQKLFPCLTKAPLKWPVVFFLFFIGVALLASLCNTSTLPKFPRIVLWGCCVFSGIALGLAVPRNGGAFLWAVLASIMLSFLVAALFFEPASPAIWHKDRLKLFAIHPSRLALYSSVVFLFVLYRSVAGKRLERSVAIAGMLFLLFILVKTNTRGNLLMLPLGILCLGAAVPKRHWKRYAGALFLCVLVAGSAIWNVKDTNSAQRLISAVSNMTEDGTFKSRLPIWEAGWESFKQRPAIGFGHQSYLKLHAAYVEKHEADLNLRYDYYEKSVKQAHNIVLGRLVETGIIGAVAFFLFYFGAMFTAWKGPVEKRWLIAPLIFYLAMSMFDDGLFRMNDAFILFLAGYAWASGAGNMGSKPCTTQLE